MSAVPFTAADAGCIFDGALGQVYNDCRVIELAGNYGFALSGPDACSVAAYGNGEADDDDADRVTMQSGIVDDALEYLNTHAAPAGYAFEWSDGDFVLSPDDADDDARLIRKYDGN